MSGEGEQVRALARVIVEVMDLPEVDFDALAGAECDRQERRRWVLMERRLATVLASLQTLAEFEPASVEGCIEFIRSALTNKYCQVNYTAEERGE